MYKIAQKSLLFLRMFHKNNKNETFLKERSEGWDQHELFDDTGFVRTKLNHPSQSHPSSA